MDDRTVEDKFYFSYKKKKKFNLPKKVLQFLSFHFRDFFFPNNFRNFFREIKVVSRQIVKKSLRFHDFFLPNNVRNFSRQINVVSSQIMKKSLRFHDFFNQIFSQFFSWNINCYQTNSAKPFRLRFHDFFFFFSSPNLRYFEFSNHFTLLYISSNPASNSKFPFENWWTEFHHDFP